MRYTLGRLAAAPRPLLAHGPAMAELPEEPRVIDSMAEVAALAASCTCSSAGLGTPGFTTSTATPPRRLHTRPAARAGHPRRLRGPGRARLHVPPAQGSQAAGRAAFTAEDFRFYWEMSRSMRS